MSELKKETQEAAIESFENEGGALMDGPHVRGPQGRGAAQGREKRGQTKAYELISNPYVSGVVSCAIFELIRRMIGWVS
jgi:hypothetical protein